MQRKSQELAIILVIIYCVTFSGGLLGQSVSFFKSIDGDRVIYGAKNQLFGPIAIYIRPASEKASQFSYNDVSIIPPRDSVDHVLSFLVNEKLDTSSIELEDIFEITAVLGNPDKSTHDDAFMYELPFKRGKSYPVIQSWNGHKSHRSKKSKYAIDFKIPVGDTIYAARNGIVAQRIDNFKESGGKSLIDKANKIVILHSDGTLGYYVHLDHKGVLVKPGDFVETGQAIGIAGNTGYSSIPHLHFVVREAPDKSVPVFFNGYKAKHLKENHSYLRK